MPRDIAFFKRGNQRVWIIGGNCNGIDALGNQAVNDFDLAFSGCVCWTGVNNINAAQFSGSFFGAFCGSFKKPDTQGFDNQSDFHIPGLNG